MNFRNWVNEAILQTSPKRTLREQREFYGKRSAENRKARKLAKLAALADMMPPLKEMLENDKLATSADAIKVGLK